SRLSAAAAGGEGAAGAAWDEIVAMSADRRVPVPATDTVRAAARRLVREHRLDAGAQDAVRAVVTAIEASWFGDRHPAPAELTGPVRTVRDAIAAGSPLTLRARLLPPSVLTRAARPSEEPATTSA
ncbi:DUF4129 domain-containing protein, partial [Pseudonocardia abyssalis]